MEISKEEVKGLIAFLNQEIITCEHSIVMGLTRTDNYHEYKKANLERIKEILELQDEECKHIKRKKVHDSDCFPYGDGVEYELCLDCGERINLKVF